MNEDPSARILELESALAGAKQTIAQLKKENSQANELDELRNTFIATNSHQLRTPLTQVKWILSALESDSSIQALPKQLQLIRQAFTSVDRIIDTVNDTINVARIQHGRIPYLPRAVDPAKCITDIIQQKQDIAASKQITIASTLRDLPASCLLDPVLFSEAVEAMINNALDYSTGTNEITLEAFAKQDEITVSVTNVGIGITAADQGKIGLPFFRAQPAIMSHPDGSGLAIYLAQAIARVHGGYFELTDASPASTTFMLRVPVRVPEAADKH